MPGTVPCALPERAACSLPGNMLAFAELHLTNRVQQAGACVPEAGTHA
jgi:hypothetical protein